jgi:hypothetical protein
MTKFIVLIAALVAASPMPSFAQTAEPPRHETGIVDTLLEHADEVLSSCNQHASRGVIDDLLKNADRMRCQIGREINETALSNCRHEHGHE